MGAHARRLQVRRAAPAAQPAHCFHDSKQHQPCSQAPALTLPCACSPSPCSVLFEEKDDEHFAGLCLNGIAQAVRLTCLLNMAMLRNTFVSSLARFTMLHSPAAMKLKSAWAFRWARAAAAGGGREGKRGERAGGAQSCAVHVLCRSSRGCFGVHTFLPPAVCTVCLRTCRRPFMQGAAQGGGPERQLAAGLLERGAALRVAL